MDWMRPGVGVLGLWVPLLAVLLLGVCQAHPIPDSSPLLQFGGQVRQRHLYTDDDQGTEAHLEVREDGTVVGATLRSPESECGVQTRVSGSPRSRQSLSAFVLPHRSPGAQSLEARGHSNTGHQGFQVSLPTARWNPVRIGESLSVVLSYGPCLKPVHGQCALLWPCLLSVLTRGEN